MAKRIAHDRLSAGLKFPVNMWRLLPCTSVTREDHKVTPHRFGGVIVKNASVFSRTFGFGVLELKPQCGNSANKE